MRQVNVHEAKTSLSRLLEEVEAGEKVVIARAGEPVAVIVPYRTMAKKRRLGLLPGQATIHPDFDDLPADIAAAFCAE
jgi:prevent-host-death family protein